jgi:SM-20-related protein
VEIPLTPQQDPVDSTAFDAMAVALESSGYARAAAFVPEALTEALFHRCREPSEQGFRVAGIGREEEHQLNPFVRTDEIRWLSDADPVEAAYLTWMEQLRLALNRRLFLGLFDYECHFARYAPGAYYKRHLDAFQGRANRVLSTVLYLNPGWLPGDGGELLLYPGRDEVEPLERVAPRYGELLAFLSERFPHEVLPARRERYSIAGWFRVNASLGGAVDPPR